VYNFHNKRILFKASSEARHMIQQLQQQRLVADWSGKLFSTLRCHDVADKDEEGDMYCQ
jgi:hypothetical protein